jgi:N-acetylglucosaminyldiphosphoundecaprenol N-acetyl-beta-D-mannosaminyltransferase
MYLRYGDASWDEAGEGLEQPARRTEPQAPKRKANRGFPTVSLAGVKLDAITETQCIGYIMDELAAGRGGMLVTPNLDHLHRCTQDVSFKAMVSEADLVVADGMPLVWASKLQGTPLPERVAGSNLITTLSAAAATNGRSVYLLGGSEGTAEGAARVLKDRFPNLTIAGTYYPPVGFEKDAHEMAAIVADLSSTQPAIVYVALGSPKQEKLIVRLRDIVPEAWWVGVGNSFSFLCGDVQRAPRWMQVSGLEWMHRLVQEPKRLFRRYVMVGLPFAATLLTKSTLKGMPHRLRKLTGKRNEVVVPAIPVSERVVEQLPRSIDEVANKLSIDTGEMIAANRVERATLAEVRFAPFDIEPRQTAASLSRLRALVLLGGSVRPSPLAQMTGRSVLDLPLDDTGTILSHWIDSAAELAKSIGLEELPVRVMVNQASPEPTSAAPKHYGTFRVERDSSDFRGTGGVLRDLAIEYGDDDLILVGNAAQVLLDPLPKIVAAMTRKAGDVIVISHEDGTPSGLMLVTCKTLRSIADAGYVDMKEQALPQIAMNYEVRVVRRRRPTGLPIRTLEDFVQALRLHHRRKQGKPFIADPLAEDFTPAFAMIEPGATVDPTARVHDSIVLAGGVVEAGAVLVRSMVCAGEVIRHDKTVVDQLVCGQGKGSRRNGFDVIQKTISTAAAV